MPAGRAPKTQSLDVHVPHSGWALHRGPTSADEKRSLGRRININDDFMKPHSFPEPTVIFCSAQETPKPPPPPPKCKNQMHQRVPPNAAYLPHSGLKACIIHAPMLVGQQTWGRLKGPAEQPPPPPPKGASGQRLVGGGGGVGVQNQGVPPPPCPRVENACGLHRTAAQLMQGRRPHSP